MEETIESLDFLQLLDNVADETVSNVVNETGPKTTSCHEFDENYTLDLFSMCDTMSVNDAMSLPKDNIQTTEADDNEIHVQSNVFEPTARTLDSKMTFRPVAFENVDGCCNSTTAILYPSVHQSSFNTNGAGQARDGSSGKPGRWYFSRQQREQLDEVFRSNMYPSRWTLAELSSTLQVPVRNLRNRRWRYRKTMGLKGDLRTPGLKGDLGTRGSRTKLTVKDMKRQGQTGHLFPRPSGGTAPEVGVTSPRPVTSSFAQWNTTSSSSSAPGLYRPTPLYFTPAQHPLYSSLGQQHAGAWHWSMSTFSANWNWFTPSPYLYPFSSSASAFWPNSGYGQPLLYPMGMGLSSLEQMWRREISEAWKTPGYGQAAIQPASCESAMPRYLLHHSLQTERDLPLVGGQTESTALDCTVSKHCTPATCHSTVDSTRTMTSQTQTPPRTDMMTSLPGVTVQNPDMNSSIFHASCLKNDLSFNQIDTPTKENVLALSRDHFHMATTPSPAVHPLQLSEVCLNSHSGVPDRLALSASKATSVYPEPGFSLSSKSVSRVEFQSAASTSGDHYDSGVSRVADVRDGWSAIQMRDVEETNGCGGDGDLEFVDITTVDQSIQ